MEENKIAAFIESSFLKPLLEDSEVTDISYNGESFFYLHNKNGRRKAKANLKPQEAIDFIRQIANLSEKSFSYANPVLDISEGRYRVNAVHPSIARNRGRKSITFSIRIASLAPRITSSSDFLNNELKLFFSALLENGISIVIGGKTGSGKTEFQKYLLRSLPKYSRVVIIDNVLELDCARDIDDIDINSWQYDQNNSNINISFLVKNALRSNPDWLIVAESRGEEMNDVLISAQTGHPIITTLHAFDSESIPYRMSRMIMMSDKKSDIKEILSDIFYVFKVYVFLERTIDKVGTVNRRIKEISIEDKSKLKKIYFDDGKTKKILPLPKEFLYQFKNWGNYKDLRKSFREEQHE